jgi:hypothetical protein
MRISQVSLSAVGVSPWIPHDYWQTPPAISLAGFISGISGAGATWGVQFTQDDIGSGAARPVQSISQTTTVITVTGDPGPLQVTGYPGVSSQVGHGLSVGDSVMIFGTGTSMDGYWPVATVPSATSYTLTSTISQSAGPALNGSVVSARVFPHSVLVNQTVRAISNYILPVRASRLQVTAWTAGVVTLQVAQGGMSS